jgi:hypothetical protein
MTSLATDRTGARAEPRCKWIDRGDIIAVLGPLSHSLDFLDLAARPPGPKSHVVALPEKVDALEAAMLESLAVAIHAVRFRQAPLLEPVSLLRACSIDILILQVPKIAGAGEVHGVEPLVHRRAAALVPTVSCDSGGSAMLASPIRGRVVLAGIPDGDGDASGGRGANPSAGSTKLRQNLQGGEIRTAAVGSHLGRV